jgi:hypothetical protein
MKRGSTAQVVLLPEGAIGDAVLRLAERWTLEGLLDPVYWVPASAVKEHVNLPALVTATVMGRSAEGQLETRNVRLLATLSADRLEQVVVTSVRWLAPQQTDREAVSTAAERLFRAIKDSLPTGFDYKGEALSGTALRSINLVLAATAIASDEVQSLLSSTWQENVVVSPENRQRPAAADTFNDPTDTEAWASFIASSVASLAGLWTGMTSTPIPRRLGSGMVSETPQVRVARTFTRAVISSDYTFRLARAVAQRLSDAASLLRDPMITSLRNDIYVLDDEETDVEIARALQFLKTADSNRLTYQSLAEPEALATKRVGFKAVGDFLLFSFDKLASIPSWIITWFVDRASRKAQQGLYGDDAGVSVDFRADVGLNRADRDLLEIADQLHAMRKQLQAQLDAPRSTVQRINAPTLWAAIRAVVFSLSDGVSDSPEYKPLKIEGKPALVADVGLVVPLPNESWHLPEDARRLLTGNQQINISTSWAGVKAAEALRDHLNDIAVLAEARVETLRQAHDGLLHECFTAERVHVEVLHRYQDTTASLRAEVGDRETFKAMEVSA